MDSSVHRTQMADLVGPIIAGLLLGCAARVDSASWLIWVALVPMLLAVRTGTGYFNIGVGSFLGGVAYSLLGCDWIRTVDHGDGLPFQRVREWLVLSQLCAVSWPISAVAARWLWTHRRIGPELGFCLVWVVCDFARGIVGGAVDGLGFPYLYLAQSSGIPLIVAQVGDLGGMYAITACIVGVNAILAGTLIAISGASRSRPRWVERRALANAALVAAGVACVMVYGAFRLRQSAGTGGPDVTVMPLATVWQSPPASPPQPAHGPMPKLSVRKKTALVVWPEVAYPSSLFGNLALDETNMTADPSRPVGAENGGSRRRLVHEANLADIRRWSKALDAALVVGCVRQEYRDGAWRKFNCALVLAPGDSPPKYYDKIALVPGSEGAPRLGGWLGYETLPTYERGTRFPVFSVGSSPESSYRFGVAICYDICFPEIFREYFSQVSHPDFFVVPGAEALDRPGQLKGLLLRMARLRAIEMRRPIVRCIHDGYSCMIDGNGRIQSLAEQLTLSSPFRLGDVPRDERRSLYTLWGDWLPKAGIGLLVAIVAWRRRRRRTTARSLLDEWTSLDKATAKTGPESELIRAGFTLVELLLAIAILGILTGLLLTAVQYARESSRKLQCTNNLHQIGVALQSYHSAHNTLPPGVIWSPSGEPLGFGKLPIGVIDRVARYGGAQPDTIYGNWVMMILPQLEELSLHAQFSFSRPISDAVNASAAATDLAILKCPSDSHNGSDNHFERGLAAGLSTYSYARGNYAINVGPDGNCAGPGTAEEPCVNGFFIRGTNLLKNNDQVWGTGVAGVNKSFNFRAVTDGLSKTVAVDEIRAGLDPLDPRGVWALGQVASSLIARHGKYGDAGGPNRCGSPGSEFVGCGRLTTKLGPQALQAECMTCIAGLLVDERNIQATAASMHSGGVNVLMCDGSAQFITNEIDVEIWHALHTRDGNDSGR